MGLPNRRLFIDRVGRLVKHSKRRKDYLFAVLFLDLDGVQDDQRQHGPPDWGSAPAWGCPSLGEVLRSTDTVARIGETFTVARLGGDEFTVLLDHIKDPSDAKRAAERMRKALAPPFIWVARGVHLREHRNCVKVTRPTSNRKISCEMPTPQWYRAKVTGQGPL